MWEKFVCIHRGYTEVVRCLYVFSFFCSLFHVSIDRNETMLVHSWTSCSFWETTDGDLLPEIFYSIFYLRVGSFTRILIEPVIFPGAIQRARWISQVFRLRRIRSLCEIETRNWKYSTTPFAWVAILKISRFLSIFFRILQSILKIEPFEYIQM